MAVTHAEQRIMQAMFFHHPGGRILERELRDIGHLDRGVEDMQAMIEHNTVKRILGLFGAVIHIARERIPDDAAPSQGTEQDVMLGVKETDNAGR